MTHWFPPVRKGEAEMGRVLPPLNEVIKGSEGPWPGEVSLQGHGHGRAIEEASPGLSCFASGLFGIDWLSSQHHQEMKNGTVGHCEGAEPLGVASAICKAQKFLKLLLTLREE